MALKLYNYYSRKIEEFKPIGNVVGLYTCGPTVYDNVHIGNWRTFVFEDVLKRVLTFNGYELKHVMNLTDIDDKIIKKAHNLKVNYREITNKYADAFFEDLKKLNIIPANAYPRATETKYMKQMISMISILLKSGFAYSGDDGIYFSVEKFTTYGKLSGLDKKNLKKGARVNDDEYDKENWTDFALWKFKRESEPSWEAPFGEGRPGWHIECSAMSTLELGDTFDIHTGGVDLLFPHHENEIAQSEAATGKKFVHYWMEGEHLQVDSAKMAKRDGNVYTLVDIAQKGFEPLAMRYLFLTAHYRSKLNFTWESLASAKNALNNIRQNLSFYKEKDFSQDRIVSSFRNAIDDDLNMPRAVAVFHEALKSGVSKVELLKMDEVLGLELADTQEQKLPTGAQKLLDQREAARAAGNFGKSDELREVLMKMGVEVEDTTDGPKWKVKNDTSY